MQVLEVPVPHVGPGTVLVRNFFPVVSARTERMLVEFGKAGYISKAKSQPDKVKQVLGERTLEELRLRIEVGGERKTVGGLRRQVGSTRNQNQGTGGEQEKPESGSQETGYSRKEKEGSVGSIGSNAINATNPTNPFSPLRPRRSLRETSFLIPFFLSPFTFNLAPAAHAAF